MSRRWARAAGFLTGLALVTALLAGERVAGGTAEPGAHVRLTVNRTGELDVTPAGRLLDVRDLAPGAVHRAHTTVRNLTADRLEVGVRAHAPTADLDDQLDLRLRVPGRRLFAGTLRALRAGPHRRLALAPGERATIAIRLELTGDRYRARGADVALELLARAAGG